MYEIMQTEGYRNLIDSNGLVGEFYNQFIENGSFNLEKGLESLLSNNNRDNSNDDFVENMQYSKKNMYETIKGLFDIIRNSDNKNTEFYLQNVGIAFQSWIASSALSANIVFKETFPRFSTDFTREFRRL